MSIGIFLGTLGTRAGGCETYEHSLLSGISKYDRTTPYDIFFLNHKAKESVGQLPENFTSHVLWPDNRWMSMTLSLPILLQRMSIKVLHATYFPPYFCPVDQIAMMHSVVTYRYPELFPLPIRIRLNLLIDRIIAKANLIICVSQHDRDFIAEQFHIPDDRLAVVYHGVSPHFYPRPLADIKPTLKNLYGISAPYFIYAGKLMHIKNITRMLKAYQLCRTRLRGQMPDLVLAGRMLWIKGDDRKQLFELIEQGGVICLDHIPHQEMPLLYAGAHALLFPSLWEGFGIPIIEAMASGIPVLTSNLSSCPEVLGDAGLTVDPFDMEQIAAGIEQLVENSALRQEMTARGLARVKQFTWERTVAETLKLYAMFS
jgi:glycosyltransferase involved in cell wall biosynthesis